MPISEQPIGWLPTRWIRGRSIGYWSYRVVGKAEPQRILELPDRKREVAGEQLELHDTFAEALAA